MVWLSILPISKMMLGMRSSVMRSSFLKKVSTISRPEA